MLGSALSDKTRQASDIILKAPLVPMALFLSGCKIRAKFQNCFRIVASLTVASVCSIYFWPLVHVNNGNLHENSSSDDDGSDGETHAIGPTILTSPCNATPVAKWLE